jgi:hypothetical protein
MKTGRSLRRIVKREARHVSREREGEVAQMRCIVLLLTVGVVAAAMVVLGGGAAFAASVTECTKPGTPKPGQVTCVTTTVTEETKFVERTVTEFAERTVTEDVVTTATEFVERPTTGPCQVGNSDRVGTAGGIATDEVLVTTTETFEVLLRDEFLVTLEDEILVTTTTVTTVVTQGTGGKVLSTVTGQPQVKEVLQNTEEVGRKLVETTEVGRELVNTDVQREVVGTTFNATGKCKNVSGPQPQTRG